MERIERLAREIVAREGGMVDDPDDPGGPTNRGITLATLRRLGADLDGDGRVNRADLARLTAERAAELLVRFYFYAPRLDLLPEPLQPPVFDMQVNAGRVAVRLLQGVLVRLGHALAVDGIIGPITARAARAEARRDARRLVDAYGIARRNYYYRLGDLHPRLRKFARRRDGGKGGWILRAEHFISPALRLSEAEHRRRVAAWG